MCARYLGFVLLVLLPGFLHAQIAKPSCRPPELTDGYFIPQQNTYPDGKTLTYGCEAGFKPVVEGWWATSICQDGKWSHTPQCIGIRSCLSPTIPNGKYEEAQNGWYEENTTIKVNCEAGFAVKQGTNTARCSNGAWSPLPVCEKRNNACDAPDKIPHGVIVGQEPKEVYAHTSHLEYACEEGYTTGQEDNRKNITCQRGRWTPEPSCILEAPSCVFDPSQFYVHQASHVKIKGGETKTFDCKWAEYQMIVKCSNGRLVTTDCCHRLTIEQELCRFR